MSIQHAATARSQAKSAEIAAVVIRHDPANPYEIGTPECLEWNRLHGRKEDLGTISFWHLNPLKRVWFQIKKLMGVV